MTVKRINFTGRETLHKHHANIEIFPGNPATFKAILNLPEKLLKSAPQAAIFVEAVHGATSMRFQFGTVAKLDHPSPMELRLTEFDDWKYISFRVKVTDMIDAPGRIVAWANNIQPVGQEDSSHKDLVRWMDAELGGNLWDIDFDFDDSGPVVLVEKTIGHATVGQNPHFIAVAYPEILRRTLENALLVKRLPLDDKASWFSSWYNSYLIDGLGLQPAPPDAEDVDKRRDWIEAAVREFGRKFKIADQWVAATGARGLDK